MSPETLARAIGCTLLTASRYAKPLTDAMKRWGIDTPLRQAAFLGQISVESGRLSLIEENLNYTATRLHSVWPNRFPTVASATPYAFNAQLLANKVYGGRMGNTQPGDGYKYRGRGLKQLTGRDNYTAYAKASGQDAVNKPDLLLDAHYAADSAGWYWHVAKCASYADRKDWKGLTKAVNGGYNGLAERIKATEKAMAALGVA